MDIFYLHIAYKMAGNVVLDTYAFKVGLATFLEKLEGIIPGPLDDLIMICYCNYWGVGRGSFSQVGQRLSVNLSR